MAAKKNTSEAAVTTESEPTFSKEQIVASAKFANRRDLVDALLQSDQSYTIKEVDQLVDDFQKGKVK